MRDIVGIPDLGALKRRAQVQATADHPDGITVTFTVLPGGDVTANIPPGLSIGAIGSIVLIMQRVGMALLNQQMSND